MLVNYLTIALLSVSVMAGQPNGTIELENHRVSSAQSSQNIHFCSESDYRFCTLAVSSPLQCTPTDNMDNVASIAIDLGLCCRFYSDNNCGEAYQGWGGDEGVWYPGNSSVTETFKAGVGSFQCLNSTFDCPSSVSTVPPSASATSTATLLAAYA